MHSVHDVLIMASHAQAAFVGLPQLDFELTLPEGVHAVVPVQYLDSWLDSFIADNILSMYMLPDHFFNPVAEVSLGHAQFCCCAAVPADCIVVEAHMSA